MNDRMYYSREAEQRAQREKLILLLLVAGVGVTVGTLIALLFAPQAGDETREQVGEQLKEKVASGQQTAQTVGEQVRERADKLREELNDRVRMQ
jgi:gas vesicle protein